MLFAVLSRLIGGEGEIDYPPVAGCNLPDIYAN